VSPPICLKNSGIRMLRQRSRRSRTRPRSSGGNRGRFPRRRSPSRCPLGPRTATARGGAQVRGTGSWPVPGAAHKRATCTRRFRSTCRPRRSAAATAASRPGHRCRLPVSSRSYPRAPSERLNHRARRSSPSRERPGRTPNRSGWPADSIGHRGRPYRPILGVPVPVVTSGVWPCSRCAIRDCFQAGPSDGARDRSRQHAVSDQLCVPVCQCGVAQLGIVPLRSLTVKPSSACLSVTSMSSWCMAHSPSPSRRSGVLPGAGVRPAR